MAFDQACEDLHVNLLNLFVHFQRLIDALDFFKIHLAERSIGPMAQMRLQAAVCLAGLLAEYECVSRLICLEISSRSQLDMLVFVD